MGLLTHTNVYPSHYAYRGALVLFIAFVAYWVAQLLDNLFHGILHRKKTGALTSPTPRRPVQNYTENTGYGTAPRDGHEMTSSSVVVAPKKNYGVLKRIQKALLRFLVSLSIVYFLNIFVNGGTKAFEILLWILLGLGLAWAVGRGLVKRFADVLLLLIIPGFILTWVIALHKPSYD